MVSIEKIIRIADQLDQAGMIDEAESLTLIAERLAQIRPNVPVQMPIQKPVQNNDENYRINPFFLDSISDFGRAFRLSYPDNPVNDAVNEPLNQ